MNDIHCLAIQERTGPAHQLRLFTGEDWNLRRPLQGQPDLAFAGGITGTRKIADFAALTRNPVALHNVGSLVLTYANAHFGSSIQNFYRSESTLGRPTRYVEDMAASHPPQVRKSRLTVPMEPGLGADLNPDFLKKHLAPDEQYWGAGPEGAA